MNILHLSTPISWRGGEQQIAYLVEELNKKNVSQWIACSKGSEMEKYCLENKINFISGKKTSSINLFSAYKLSKVCRNLKIDVLHAHDSHAHSIAVLSCAFFNNTTPVVLSRKVDFPIRNNWFSVFKYNHPCIKKIICVSEKITEILSGKIQDKTKLKVIYDGIDISKLKFKSEHILRKEFNVKQDEIIIGNVSAIAPHKDYYTFVDTAELLLKQNLKAKFFIIGDGPERKRITDYVESKNLSENIIFTGFRADIPRVLPELDVLLFTSKTEGLGSSLLDASVCGVPVVATSAGGIPEIVIDGETGLLAPPQDAVKLAEQTMRLLGDSSLKQRLIDNAREQVKKFSKTKNGELTLGVYQELIVD